MQPDWFVVSAPATARSVVLLALACAAPACGGDRKPQKGASSSGADGGHEGQQDSGSDEPEQDGSLSERDAGPGDAGDEPDAAPIEPAPSLDGLAFVETEYSLTKPAALAPVLHSAQGLLGDGRVFANSFAKQGAKTLCTYGAADPSGDHYTWQNPLAQRASFSVVASSKDPLIWQSDQPFTYDLEAQFQLLGETAYLSLTTQDAVYSVRFDEGYKHIVQGTLQAVLTRAGALASPLEGGALLCVNYCPADWCASNDLATLADVLDCQSVRPDLDRDADGTKDAYSLSFSFKSVRATLQDAPPSP
jgi:hypothetical protein